jgi:uracil-DNA glycosylase
LSGHPKGKLKELREKNLRYTYEELSIPVVAAYHPAFVLRQGKQARTLRRFLEDLERAKALVESLQQEEDLF